MFADGRVLEEPLAGAERHTVLVPRGDRRAGLLQPRMGLVVSLHRELAARSAERDVVRRSVGIPVQPIGCEHRAHHGDAVGAQEPLGVAPQVDCRHLSDDGLDPGVEPPEVQHVPPTERRAPDGDPLSVDLRALLEVGNRVAVVVVLRSRIDVLARLAAALAPAPTVEQERHVAGVGELATERIEIHLLDRAESVRHHDPGTRPRLAGAIGQVQLAGALDALTAQRRSISN